MIFLFLMHTLFNQNWKIIVQASPIRVNLQLMSNPSLNHLSANPTKWSNTLKQFVGNLPTNCLSVFDHIVKLALKRLIYRQLKFMLETNTNISIL